MLSPKSIEGLVASFMEARCDVSSQHKLPTRDEILGTATAQALGARSVDVAIDAMLEDGRLIQYGPHISDHAIEVL